MIAPDARGYGRTVHPGGSIPSTQLADDVIALIDALGLGRPALCGFSDGALTATLVGIRAPGAVSAIVNHSGYDLFNPRRDLHDDADDPRRAPDATEADPAAASASSTPPTRCERRSH